MLPYNNTNGKPNAKITEVMITLTKPIERKGCLLALQWPS